MEGAGREVERAAAAASSRQLRQKEKGSDYYNRISIARFLTRPISVFAAFLRDRRRPVVFTAAVSLPPCNDHSTTLR